MSKHQDVSWQQSTDRSFWGFIFLCCFVACYFVFIQAAHKSNISVGFSGWGLVTDFLIFMTLIRIILKKRTMLLDSLIVLIWVLAFFKISSPEPWMDSYVKSLDVLRLMIHFVVLLMVAFVWPFFLLVDIKKQLKK